MNNSNPKVSIIMPVYNAEKYIVESVNSLLNQSFSDFELIIVNDSSTDNTSAIINALAKSDNRIKIFNNNENQGIARSLNVGLLNAKGIYIARADGDDINLTDRLKIQVDFLEKNNDTMLCGGGYAPFNENGVIKKIFHPSNSIILAWKFITNTYFCHPTVMFRKEIYDNIGGYPVEVSEDFAFFSLIVKKYKVNNLKVILVNYRIHNTNYSSVKVNQINDSVKKISLQNFLYYYKNEKLFNEYYEYHKFGRVKIRNLLTMLQVDKVIIKKILDTNKYKIIERFGYCLFKSFWDIRVFLYNLYIRNF